MKCKCDDCTASALIKSTLQCSVDQLCNRGEILLSEIYSLFGIDYKPKFNCGCSDLFKFEMTEGEK